MPELLTFENVDEGTRLAVLEFINRAPYAEYLTRQWWFRGNAAVKNDPSKPLSISVPLAAAMLQLRNSRPGAELENLDQLNEVEGFRQGHLDFLADLLSDYGLHRNRTQLCVDGPACRELLLNTIYSAKNYIHLACFLFFNDEAGQEIARALAEKARQGVEVRVLLDQRSSEMWLMDEPELRNHPTRYNITGLKQGLTAAGVRVADMQPIEREVAEFEVWRNNRVPETWLGEQERINEAIWSTVGGWNHVDHRKILIADGRRALVMSHCLGNEYLYADAEGPRRGDGDSCEPRWHDAATLVVGGAAARLNIYFARRWVFSGGDVFPIDQPFYSPPPEPAGNDTVTFQASVPGDVLESWLDRLSGEQRQQNPVRNLYGYDLLWLAREEVWMENPYVLDMYLFKMWKKLMRLKPHLKFNLIRPHHSVNSYPGLNIPGLRGFIKRMFWRNDPELIKWGVKIWEYTRGFNHIKIALVDNWLATHGSYNLNYRSAKKDLELNVVIESRAYAAQVRELFNLDLGFCRLVKPTRTDRAISTVFRAAGDLAIIDTIMPEVG